MQNLENYLSQLTSSTGDPLDIIHDIKHACFQDVATDKFGLICTILFRSDNSILNYLETTVRNRDHKLSAKPRESLFGLIVELISFTKKYKFTIQDYYIEIMNTAVSLFRKDEDNRVKVAALTVLKALIKLEFTLDIEQLKLSALIDLFLSEYNVGKSTAGVKAAILELFGVISDKYPGEIVARAPTIQKLYIDALKQNFDSKKGATQQIAASMSGLAYLLKHFSADFIAVPANVHLIYKYICLGLEIPEDLARYNVPKGALLLLGEHANLFKQYLTEDSKRMFTRLSNLCKHRNKDVSHRAFFALNTFLKQVSDEIVSSNRSEESNIDTFKFFIRKFSELLDSQSSDSMQEISIALRGFGMFSGAILRYVGLDDLKKQCAKLFQFSERFFASDFEQLDETAYHLPSFIIAFSNAMLFMDNVEENHIDYLEKLVSAVFVFYPQLHSHKRDQFAPALSRLFTCLFSKGSALKELLSRIIYKGLILTCTKPLSQSENESILNAKSYENYIQLWKAIMIPVPLLDLELNDNQHNQLKVMIYEQLITSIMLLVQKLDLTYSLGSILAPGEEKEPEKKELETDVLLESDNLHRLLPNKPADFELFFNLVDFSREILLKYNTQLFTDWVHIFGKEMIKLSNQFPLISGFYKFLTITMVLSERNKYFENITDRLCNKDKISCFQLFNKYRKEVECRVRQYKNELLAACVRFVLSVPKEFLNDSTLPIRALEIALKIGLSYIELAEIGLDALEYWIRVKNDIIHKYLHLILPPLQDYLLLDSFNYEKKIVSRYDQSFTFKERVATNKVAKASVLEQSEGMQLQIRILRLLGRLGGNNLKLLSERNGKEEGIDLERGRKDNSKPDSSSVVWDTTKRIKFHFPFKDMKPVVFLDGFLPRIVEIAENAKERQSKVAACELLHSIVLYMIGTSAHKQSNLTKYYKLYERIFPALLRLCTSVESVAKQLFRPLVFQLVYWFTKNIQNENVETMTLLDAIVDSVGNTDDGALREFSAECLAYFLECSLFQDEKREKKENKENSPINVKSLFKRLYSLAHHPEPYKRVGCALTFNKVYKIFRENEKIVDLFIFEILQNLLFSLRLADRDEKSMKTQEIISTAVDNISKIIVTYCKKKVNLLVKPSPKRREFPTLAHFVEWIFEEIKRPENYCRKVLMRIFIEYCNYLPGIKSSNAWISKKLQLQSVEWLLNIFENKDKLIKLPEINDNEEENEETKLNENVIKIYFVQLTGLLDIYHWMFVHNFIEPNLLTSGNKKTKLFTYIHFFINHFALIACPATEDKYLISDKLKYYHDVITNQLSPSEYDEYNRLKSRLLIQLVEFIHLLFEKYDDFHFLMNDKQDDLFENEYFYLILFYMILAPSRIGILFDYQLNEWQFNEVLSKLSKILINHLDQHKKAIMISQLKYLLRKPEFNLLKLTNFKSVTPGSSSTGGFNMNDSNSILSLISGYILLYNHFYFNSQSFQKYISSLILQISMNLFENTFSSSVLAHPIQLLISKNALDLCFRFKLPLEQLLVYLTDTDIVENLEQQQLSHTVLQLNPSNKSAKKKKEGDADADAEEMEVVNPMNANCSKGMVFYNSYTEVIIKYFILNYQEFIKVLFQYDYTEHPVFLKILFDLLDNLSSPSFNTQYLLNKNAQHAEQGESQSENKKSSKNKSNKKEEEEIREYKNKIISEIFEYLPEHTKEWYNDKSSYNQKEHLLEIIKKLLTTNAKYILTELEGGYEYIENIFLSFTSRNIHLSFKLECLFLINYLFNIDNEAVKANESKLDKIKTSVDDIIIYNFPVNLSDIPKGTALFMEIKSTLEKLFDSLIFTQNIVLLKCLIPILRGTSGEEFIKLIDKKLNEFILSIRTEKNIEIIFNELYTEFNDENHPYLLRKSIINKLILPLLYKLSENQLLLIAKSTIKSLMQIINEPLIPIDALLPDSYSLTSSSLTTTHASKCLDKSGDAELIITDFIKRTSAFSLLTVYFDNLSSNAIKDHVNQVFAPNESAKKNELTTALMKSAHQSRSKPLDNYLLIIPETVVREYHCAAYNCLASVVLKTQTNPQFFTVFFFKENGEKSEYIWKNIINVHDVPKFEVETQFPVMRSLLDEFKLKLAAESKKENQKSRTSKYITSQYLLDSSLASDISYMSSLYHSQFPAAAASSSSATQSTRFEEIKLDKPEGPDKPNAPAAANQPPTDASKANSATAKKEVKAGEEEKLLEMDKINENPTMESILKILDYINKQFGNTYKADAMPDWMKLMHTTINHSTTPIAVTLFLIKIIINRPEYFEKYIGNWIECILTIMMDPSVNKNFNYYFRDLCIVLLLKWRNHHSAIKPILTQKKALLTEILQQMLLNLFYPNKYIVKCNVDIIKLYMESFQEYLENLSISKKIIFEMIGYEESHQSHKLRRIIGMQIMAILLVNNIPLFNSKQDSKIISETQLHNLIIKNLLHKNKEIYSCAAELCGLIVSYDGSNSITFVKLLKDTANKLFVSNDINKVIVVLLNISKHSANFIDQYFVKLFNLLPKLIGPSRVTALKLIRSRVDKVDDLYTNMKPVLDKITSYNDPDAQLLALDIFMHLISTIPDDHAINYIQLLHQTFTTHKNDKCRENYYKVLMKLYDKLSIQQYIRPYLLKGFCDENEEIRMQLLSFWNHNKRLSENIVDRLQEIFYLLYSPDIENQYLQISSQLLINLSENSPDYQIVLFDSLSEDSKLFEYNINHNWTHRSLPMTPLFSFSLSQSFQSSSSEYSQYNTYDPSGASTSTTGTFLSPLSANATTNPNQPAAKDNSKDPPAKAEKGKSGKVQFTPTMDSQMESDMNVEEDSQQEMEGVTGNDSVMVSDLIPASNLSLFKSTMRNKSTEQGSQIKIPKRFNKSATLHPSQTKNVWVKQALVNKIKREESLKLLREKRQNQIKMIRKYRIGEHCPPDVQIKPKEIILSFQALLSKDQILAKLLFTSLFKSIMEEYQQTKSTDDQNKNKIKEKFEKYIQNILKTTRGSTSIVYTLLTIAYEDTFIKIKPQLIYKTSMVSYNYHVGILLLEKQILQFAQQKTIEYQNRLNKKSKKSGKKELKSLEIDDEMNKEIENEWNELIKLYKSLGDEDILLGLYERLCKTSYTKKALEYELTGDYKSALVTYEQALDKSESQKGGGEEDEDEENSNTSELELSIWESSRLECMNKLMMWEHLLKETMNEVDNNPQELWNSDVKVPFLNYFLECKLKQPDRYEAEGEENESNTATLYRFIEESMKDEDKRRYLEEECLSEVSFYEIIMNDNLDKARYYLLKYYEMFLKKWCLVHPLATKSREYLLRNLQKVVEMDEFLYFQKNEKNFYDKEKLNKLIVNRWHYRYPTILQDINIWDDVINNRSKLLNKLYDRYSIIFQQQEYEHDENGDQSMDSNKRSLAEIKKLFLTERSEFYLQYAKAATKQNNIIVAETNLRLSFKSRINAFSFQFFSSILKLYLKKAKQESSFEKYIKSFEYLEEKRKEPVILANRVYLHKYHMLEAKLFNELADLILNPSVKIHDSKMLTFKSNSSPRAQLLSKAFNKYDLACQIIKDADDSKMNDADPFPVPLISASLYKFSSFCDSMLQYLDNPSAENDRKFKTFLKYAKIIIENILYSMKLGNLKSRDKFPRILQLIEHSDELIELFDKNCQEIPTWMFLRWISQMMGLIDKKQANPVINILIKIGKAYPQALIYPFSISTETLSKQTMRKLGPLSKSLNLPLIKEFITALETLTHPEHRFKDWMEALKPFIKAKDKKSILALFEEVKEDVFNEKKENIGAYNKDFAKKHKKNFYKHFTENGSRMTVMDLRAFETAVAQLNAEMMKSIVPTGTATLKLSQFSGWLVDFDQSNFYQNQYIEIPGQYTGDCPPIMDHHIKISSFDNDILIMGSIRKPKRLKIRGNDQIDHPFLIKGGEDLRLDQRVQQLFSVINEIFKHDSQCSKRKLFIPTYRVIPMTRKVGMIEWINNTKPIKALIEEEISKEENATSDVSIQRIPAAKKHDQWLKSFSSSTAKLCDTYYTMYQKSSRSDCIKKVQDQLDSINWYLLKNAVLSLSSTPETFLTIRSHFTKSLASFNIASYIIGIGDRHLENFLLNYSDGGLVGIDFGHAFGTATQFLPIPELVPFRLTNQFTNFLKPLQSEGLLKHNMIHCLRALRENKDILITTMNVFITEPLLDWEKLARRCAREQGSSGDETSWFPNEKLRIVNKKLDGFNPALIVIEELRGSIHNKKPYLKNLEVFVSGDKKENIRAKVGEQCSSVAEQVECLIDLATDPNILGRMYGGWASWI